ncbi:MAG: DNA translocase FtsK 4TM domain-containing protein [Chloroflexi bacterium]|nr:DNA translocase FtsK 4TM domain-containing protein [Chloroflexota bacterium]
MPLKIPFSKSTPPPAKGKTAHKKDDKKPVSKPPVKTAAPAVKKPAGKHVAPPPPPPLFDISAERKLDILGIVLALSGLVIILALVSLSRSSVTGTLLGVLDFLLGYGAYLLPFALIGFGGWLVLRKIDRIPPISVERVSGMLFLLLFIITAIQLATDNGGWVGSLFYRILSTNLGWGGTLVALLAWLLIALTMSFDVTVPELVGKLEPFLTALSKFWTIIFAPLQNRLGGQNSPEIAPVEDGFLPLNHPTAAPTESSAPTINAEIGIPVTNPVKQIAWVLPNITEILETNNTPSVNEEFVEARGRLIEETLASFGAPAQVVQISKGPTITQFGVEPLFVESRAGRTRVRVSKIVSLSDDLALALAAPRIRIQAPVPGRSYVGIEVPNNEMTLVTLRDLLESDAFVRARKILSFALGRDVSGLPIGADLAGMPHLLIAGTTGSGKSVCVNAILTCLLLYNTPDEVRMVLVDPKRVELTGYNGVPHLLAPVVVEMERVLGALQWMTREMDRRYHTFAQVGARNIVDYNTRMKTQGQKKLPYLVIVIDELADLMMIAPDETERTITRLAQLARATGIHMVLATQRPSVDVVTGLIKANFPARIAFAVSSNTDSRVILDQPGAERLLGRGDMLYQSPEAPSPVRLQGVFVSDHEIHRLVDFWRDQNTQGIASTPGGPVDGVPSNVPLKQVAMFGEDITAAPEQGDHLMSEAIDLVRREGRASVSMLQRKLRIGYTRAARLIDTMEEKKIVGQPQDATGVRPVLDYGPAAPPPEK